MKCQWCGQEFPHKKGRFCGTCQRPKGESVSIRGAKQRILDRMECTTFDCDDLRDKLKNKADFCRECGNDATKEIDWLKKQLQLKESELDQAIAQGKIEACNRIESKIGEWGASGSYVIFANQLIDAIMTEESKECL